MKNKNTVLIVVSVIVGVLAAVAAALLVIKHFKDKKECLETTDYLFENEFDDDEAPADEAPAEEETPAEE